MKSLAFILLALLLDLRVEQPGLTITDKRVALAINRSITLAQLTQFKEDLSKKKNIKFDFEAPTFDSEQKLLHLEFYVNCNDGYKGSSSYTFSSDEELIGFQRIYDRNSKDPFKIG